MRLASCLLVVGLLSTGCSQIVIVPPSPDGSSTTVDVAWENANNKGNTSLSKQGYAFYTDRIQDLIYRISEEDIEAQFGPALTPMREILAAGMPELPHSYAVLLQHATGGLGSLTYDSNDAGVHHQLEHAANGVFIDGYPDRPHAIDASRLQRDFGPALDSLAQTLKSMRSYIILLESPDGAASKVIFRTHDSETLLEHIGQSLTLDGIDHEADEQLATNDFGPARASTKQILDEGLPKIPHSYTALMANPAGPLGEVEILEGFSQGGILNNSGQAVIIDGYSSKIYALGEEQYRKDFGDTLTAMPPPPVTHLLYFDSGSDRLTAESRPIMPLILDEIRKHPAADVSISGYTDTVGGNELNERLSHKRSETIAALIVKSGVPTQEVSLAYFGKTDLAVDTPDNTPELLNRRVEITIR
jgi:peptidoglycan-associated lipoprotein